MALSDRRKDFVTLFGHGDLLVLPVANLDDLFDEMVAGRAVASAFPRSHVFLMDSSAGDLPQGLVLPVLTPAIENEVRT